MAVSSAYGCGKQRLRRCMQKIFRIAHTMIKRRVAQNRAFFTGSAFRLSMARDSLYAAAIAGCPDGVSVGQLSAAKKLRKLQRGAAFFRNFSIFKGIRQAHGEE